MKYIFLVFALLQIGCSELDDIAYDQFTLYKQFQYTGQIKMDGEYWAYDSANNANLFIILYRDGSYHRGGITRNNNIECMRIAENVRSVGWWWGFFNIENKTIDFQTIDPESINRNSKYQVKELRGELLNDSTFIQFNNELPGNVITIDTFYFRQCNNKPDSLNVILKNIGS